MERHQASQREHSGHDATQNSGSARGPVDADTTDQSSANEDDFPVSKPILHQYPGDAADHKHEQQLSQPEPLPLQHHRSSPRRERLSSLISGSPFPLSVTVPRRTVRANYRSPHALMGASLIRRPRPNSSAEDGAR